ncbi:MAG: SLC13 family permease, partial [Caldilineaceae bacterium]|nr:SLC13 family permease [Caldilineaceae bacterium]
YLGRFADGSARRLLLLLALVEVPSSAFMNNTPVVVMMIPVIVSLCRQYNLRPSKFLLPVSYFAILGGTVTLLGTSTNILVADLYRKAGGPAFGLFEFSALGLLYALAGSSFIILGGFRLLPEHSPLVSLLGERKHSTYITELVVTEESKLNGKAVSEAFSRIALQDKPVPPLPIRRHRRLRTAKMQPNDEPATANSVVLLEIIRREHSYQAEQLRNLQLAPNDLLIVAGTPKEIMLFQEVNNVHLATVVEDQDRAPLTDLEEQVVEAVVMPESEMVGRQVAGVMLNRRFGVKVMALQHQGRQQVQGLRQQRLEVGDVLLLRGKTAGLRMAADSCRMLLVEGVESSLVRKTKNTTALIIMGLVVLLASLTQIPIVVLAVTGATLMMVTKCLRVDEAIGSLEPSTLMLLAGTIPVGMAMETTGLVSLIVETLVNVIGTSNHVLFLSIFYIMTALLTEILSNNAVAVLLTPVALSLATSLDVSPVPLLVAVLFGASAAFMTPFGYQTNAIVMGPGGYKFVDYLRVGLPLQVIMIIIATIFIPVFWPF